MSRFAWKLLDAESLSGFVTGLKLPNNKGLVKKAHGSINAPLALQSHIFFRWQGLGFK